MRQKERSRHGRGRGSIRDREVGASRELPAALKPKPTGASFIFFRESFVPKVEDDGKNI